MRKKAVREVSACELPSPGRQGGSRKHAGGTAFYRHRGACCWTGVRNELYKQTGRDWQHIVRRVLVGGRGETAKFHLRYFEIAPGGNSSFETHHHEHAVICIRGRGKVRAGRRTRSMTYLDIIYIAPDTPHQLLNPFDEPFGFLCIVNARRDRPKLIAKR